MERNKESVKAANVQLRDQLSHITLLIEDGFGQCNNKHTSKDDDQSTHDYLNEVILFKETIDKFKFLIEEINDKMAMSYRFRLIQIKEDELKNEKIILEKIIKENKTLDKVNKRQNESLRHIENKYNNQLERSIMCQKTKNIKQEYKMIKEYYKVTRETIKTQQKKIDELNVQCDVIKDNIQRHKGDYEETAKEKGKMTETGMKTLEEKIDSKEVYSKNEEEYYFGEIRNQKEKANKVNEEIKVIKVKIKQKEQEIRMSQLKIRELNKLTHLLTLNQQKQLQIQQEQEQKTARSIKTFDIKSWERKLNLSNQLQEAQLNNRSILNAKNNYSFFKKKNDDNNNKMASQYNRGLSANNEARREKDKYGIEFKKNKVMIEIEELKMNIQKALNDNDFHYNNAIMSKKKVEIIQRENYTDKENSNIGMELSVNYDKVNYDYLERSLSYTIEQQKNSILINRNNNKEEEGNPFINKNKYNEDIIVQVKENHSNNAVDNNNNNEFLNNQNENEPQVKLFSKKDNNPRRKPFEISNF